MCTNKIGLNVDNTTYKHDYRAPKLSQPMRYRHWTRRDIPVPVDKPSALHAQDYNVKDVHTMQPWRHRVPFDLLWQPEPIVRTHPWRMKIGKITKSEDPHKTDVIRSRPRVIMAPAISMDDITDAQVRSQLCAYMYTTEQRSASSDVKFKPRMRVISDSTLEKCADPVRENSTIYKPLPVGWKTKGKQWERKQCTALVDPTRVFWLNYKHSLHTPAGVDPFKKMLNDDTRQEISNLINCDELRLAYDKVKPGYTGYRPRLVTAQLRQQEFDNKTVNS